MPEGFFEVLRDSRPLPLEAVLSFDQLATGLSEPLAQLSRLEKGLQMPVPILRASGDEPVFAIHDEVPSTPHPGRNTWHADGHELELLETALPLVHRLAMHGREPDVDPLELLNLFIELPRSQLHPHRAEREVVASSDHVNLEVIALRAKLA